MKKLVFAAVTLMVFAGSASTVPMFISPVNTAVSIAKMPVTRESIPPPSCPPHDPDGCGIFD